MTMWTKQMMSPEPIFPEGEGDIAQQCEVLPEYDAMLLCGRHNYKWRVSGRDDDYYPVTRDNRRDRVTAHIRDGRVERAYIG
jgi:hypothetical protein